ncbi:SAV_2336 N-terminal domain-related protein [Streptomyces luteireticuli]|uniref:SAV_2336 N-terminal domain-related protein n=1 Tax=Streptomyces luteireticuli TaxID=173858 RepID=UPI00355820C2
MTAPPEPWLEELVARLRSAAPDLTAEEIADAVWLARRMTPGPGEAGVSVPAGDTGPDPVLRAAVPPSAVPAAGRRAAPRRLSGDRGRSPAPASVAVRTMPRPRPEEAAGGPVEGFPVRVPTAASLPGLLGLQRALRPLRGYRSLAAPARGPLDEDTTADRAARTGVVHPVYHRGRGQSAAMQLLMDASPSMVVWERTLDEMEQICAQLGVFRDVRVGYLHRAADGTPLIGPSAARGARPRPRPAEQFLDPTGRRLTLVLSDCVGPLWQEGRAQRLLHRWSLTAPVAVVQPLPPRLWPRTALPAEPGLLTRDPVAGGRLGFEPDGFGPPPPPGALPVPVLLPVREALGAWARLLSGPGRTTVHGAAGLLRPDHPSRPVPPGDDGPGPGADARLTAFRASASPGALRLAVHLAAVPLALPVMQLVQRAMLPDTGPMELAEVLLGGLLWRTPAPAGTGDDSGPWYEFADGVRELLLQSLDRSEAALVLKHCSDYVERHFGKGARNFSALAVARLAGLPPAPGAARAPEGPSPEPELFAQVPARVVRWYRPPQAEPGPLAEAELLLELWHDQGDPQLLQQARELAAPLAAGGPGGEPDGEGVRARLVLGGVLRALAGTESVRADAPRRRELLDEAVALLAEAYAHGAPGPARETPADEDAPRHTAVGLELAAAHWDRWHDSGDADELRAAEGVLRSLPATGAPRRLHLGRVLLALAGAETPAGPAPAAQALLAEAVAELRAACDLLEAEDAPYARRSAALLDLARALRRAGAPASEALPVLDRAELTAADDLQLLHARAEQARVHTAAGDGPAADAAYTAAVSLTGRDSPRRCALLGEWGASLLERAQAEGGRGSGTVSRAEAVLREAYAVSPGRAPERPRLQLLLGRALVLRYERLGFLPDLYESCHLLEQAARRAPDAATRAESWLELGTARLALRERAPGVPLSDAADAFTAAVEEAREAAGGESGSVVAARAAHRYGDALERMGLRRQALALYRTAAGEWRDLTARLADVPWDEVRQTREGVARLSGG